MRRKRGWQGFGVAVLAAVFVLGLGSSWASGQPLRARSATARVLQIRPTFAPLIASTSSGISVVAMGVRAIPPGWVMQVGAPGTIRIVRRRTGATIKFLGGGVASGQIAIRVTRPRTAGTVWLGYYKVFAITHQAITPKRKMCVTAGGRLHSLPCPHPTTTGSARPVPPPKTGTGTTSTATPTTTTTTPATPAAPAKPAPDTTPPSTPGGLSVSNVATTTLRLNWAASSDNVGVTGYDAFLNGGKVGTVSVLYADYSGLACGTTYTLAVSADDAAGNSSPQASVTAATFACPPPPAYYETTGGVTHTWTNYTNAGGTEGATIGSNVTVQIACRLQGWTAPGDGNNWWYRIAASPWNSTYYASADAFYNNGATSGSLLGTPFYDPAVPTC